MTALAEAWLLAFLLAATLGAGVLAVLASGILLQERWVEPLRPILSAAARMMPALPFLALPLLALSGRLYPWADRPRGLVVLVASVVILLLWSVLGRQLARPAPARWGAGVALLLLPLTAAIGFEDWALSRDRGWVGSLNGLAMLIGGAAAALGMAVLVHGNPAEPEARTGLERALLALGIFTLWLLFVPFVTVWAADLPAEAAWYLRRQEGPWQWLNPGLVVSALGAALALAAVPQWSAWRMRAVCALLVLQHAGLVLWTVRPDAPLAPGATGGTPQLLADAIVIGLVALLLLLMARVVRRRGT
ncbi:hypothetical protein [Roseomonas chloroacetimidivorans]|uniref:hypothetical protein n=1 Tax=Roseomonas chloroacetimidivorans TaxID=1766656 RepID=UPI003C720878